MCSDRVLDGATVSTLVCGYIAVIQIAGVLTPASFGAIKAAVLLDLAEAGPVAGFLVHYERADVRCTAADLNALFDDEAAQSQATMPAAMVVRSDQLALFQEHSWMIAWRGIVRQSFTDAATARDWLRARAETAAQCRTSPSLAI
jgi:hypothetical protein